MVRRARRGEAASATVPETCEHLAADAESGVEPQPLTPGKCQECDELGESTWAHLRMCLTCGHMGCCDDSPNKHATKHYHHTHHPVIRSMEPGESWRWCYVDELFAE